MASIFRSRRALWLLLAAIVVLAALIVIVSPAERTLGQAVKVIYVHVALSRAGAVGFYAAGLLGLVVLVQPTDRLAWWMRAVSWAGLILFTVGFIVSGVAQMLSWGAITLQEPRVSAGANVLAVAIIAQIAALWLPWARLDAVLRIVVAGFQLWTTLRTPNILHPAGAISASGSAAIQLASGLLLVLALLLGVWIVWLLWQYRTPGESRPIQHG